MTEEQLKLLGPLGEYILSLQDRITTLERKVIQATPDANKEYYNIREAAAFLNVSVRSVRRLIDRGLLKKSLGLGKIQIPKSTLQDYKKMTVV